VRWYPWHIFYQCINESLTIGCNVYGIGGNDAASLFNCTLGSFLGIIVTPLLLFVVVGTSGNDIASHIATTTGTVPTTSNTQSY
jgi:hypothetical protein